MIKILWKLGLNQMTVCLENKKLKLHNLTVIVRSVFEEDGQYYSQVFLGEYLYEL